MAVLVTVDAVPETGVRAFQIDIWRSAALLVKQYGDEAPIHAAMRADQLLDTGDLAGQRVWLWILSAVKEQLRERGNEALH